MKKVFIGVFLAIVFIAFISAVAAFRRFAHMRYDNDGDVSLQIKETDNSYYVYARYDRHRTSSVQHYLDIALGTKDHMFRRSRLDATVSLDDHMRFYVKNTPGRLVIRLNRDENSEEAYWRMKAVAEGLKQHIVPEY